MLKYESFTASVDDDFWYLLEKKKLMEMKLEKDVVFYGYYQTGSQYSDLSSRFRITRESFFEYNELSLGFFSNASPGVLVVTNTKEEFKVIDRRSLLRESGEKIVEKINNKSWLSRPWELTSFLLLTYGDLKNHTFLYSFCFPMVKFKSKIISRGSLKPEDLKKVSDSHFAFREGADVSNQSFFCVHKETMKVHPLKDVKEEEAKNYYFAFNDSSSNEKFPGSVARNYIYAIKKTFNLEEITILSVRFTLGSTKISDRSFLCTITVLDDEKIVWVGWEKKIRRKDISSLLDPIRLAESSVNLNLQLMRWRVFPSLDLEKLSQIKALLVGSGTLGCQVSRSLLSWGITNMTFIDRGKVTHSNPVRQNLYEFEDVGKDKAICASERIQRIYPKACSRGVNIDIPMPGHFVQEKQLENTLEQVEKLKKLVSSHDVIFLLTDTRESRWLPTVLATSEDKIVINSALGFDSFLVMRHGMKLKEKQTQETEKRLGCYFCNDVVAPVNSTKDRTLDQQCTVTRPGVSSMAGSIAVEMLVGLLHHKKGRYAPPDDDDDDASELGSVPHQIRGVLSESRIFTLTGRNYSQCIACSDTVVKMYRDEGNAFLIKCFNNPGILEEITGLKDLFEKTQKMMEESFLKNMGEKKEVKDDDGFDFI